MTAATEPASPQSRDATQFLRFLAASGAAAVVNFGARIVLSLCLPFALAVVGAYVAGLTTAFLLNRLFVFEAPERSAAVQLAWFIAVNLFGLAQTLAVSLGLAYWLLPALDIRSHVELISHAAGIAAPVLTSYFLHKRLTFRGSRP